MNPEDLYTLYRERQSDRRFADRPVPQEVLERILHNALLAPSATNQQPWSIVAVSEPEAAQRVGQAVIKGVTNMNKFALEAPVHLLIVAERGRWVARMGSRVMKVDYRPIDLGILVAHIVLAAQAEGVGSCILGWINDAAVRKELGIPEKRQVVLDILIGYSDQPTREKKRKSPEEVIHWNKW